MTGKVPPSFSERKREVTFPETDTEVSIRNFFREYFWRIAICDKSVCFFPWYLQIFVEYFYVGHLLSASDVRCCCVGLSKATR